MLIDFLYYHLLMVYYGNITFLKMRSRLFIRTLCSLQCPKKTTSVAKANVKLNEELFRAIENGELKPRKHPGIFKNSTISLSDIIKKAMKKIVGDTPLKQLLNESSVLARILHARLTPIEENELVKKRAAILEQVKTKLGKRVEDMTEEELEKYEQLVNSRVDKILHQKVYNWKPLEFTRHLGLVYMTCRAAPEYAILCRVFQEISRRDASFKPTSLFDFGSGIGTVTWASTNYWPDSIKEYFCVDSSGPMNILNKEMLEMVNGNVAKRTFYRQFLPASSERDYDIVVSAFSLLELPSLNSRLQTIHTLWQKCNRYLVIVERGTIAGFKLVNEARNFILGLSQKDSDSENKGHVFAPCQHDLNCPRIKKDHTPCNFLIPYATYPQKEEVKKELYSYVILRKGKNDSDDRQWPRIVRPVLVRSKHAVCRMCDPNGNLREIIFTPTKHGKIAYRCAKSTRWGDLLPITINSEEEISQ